jgi:hypothetical protein
MSRSPSTWSCRVSFAERGHSSFALTIMCRFFSSLSFDNAVDDRQWEVQALSDKFHAGARCRCRVSKKVFTSRARWILL